MKFCYTMAAWYLAVLQLLMLNTIVMGESKNPYVFPKDVMIGAATSAYQIEGAWNVDGKGPSIWDKFTHEHPELISDRSNGNDAAKSYYKYKEDIKALKDMGMQFYRFSISWPRIIPDGLPNKINQKGIDYYNNLINEALKNGIIPLVTMYHWDLPTYLQNFGGWTNETIVTYFESYARVLFDNFGDRVKWWITLNEPMNAALGYETITFAPGMNSSGVDIYLAAHNLLKAHARAYHLYSKHYRKSQNGKLSISNTIQWAEPINETSSTDIEAVRLVQNFFAGIFNHPIYSKEGDYPQLVKDRVGNLSLAQGFPVSRLPKFTQEEVEYIRGTADFYAINEYTTLLATQNDSDPTVPSFISDVGARLFQSTSWPESKTSQWESVAPMSIRNILKWINTHYGEKWEFFITENGFGDEGQLNDEERTSYLAVYMIELLKAIHIDKCKVIGYTVWSLIDNFEWINGYTSKFGLYHVDFNDPDRRRTPKQSAYFMGNITKTRQVPDKYISVDTTLDEEESLQLYRTNVSYAFEMFGR